MNNYTVIIPTLSNVGENYLRLCVGSLRASGFRGRIIVVTNGAKSSYPLNIDGISVRLHTSDQGQCVAVNIGMQQVDTEYALITNDDMYYAPGWDKNLRFDYPCFSPNLMEPTDNAGSAEPFVKVNGGYTLDAFNKKFVDAAVGLESHNPYPDESGFNLPFFIKKDLWDHLGGYDTAYDPWGSNSDTDLQTRMNLAGVTPMRLRNVLVYHFSNKSGTFDGTHQDFYQNNIDYFHDKFGFDRDELGSDVWRNKDMIPEDKTRIRYDQKPYSGN